MRTALYVITLLILSISAHAQIGVVTSDGNTSTVTIIDANTTKTVTLNDSASANDIEKAMRYNVFKRFDYTNTQKLEDFLESHPGITNSERARLLFKVIRHRHTRNFDRSTSFSELLEAKYPNFKPAERIANAVLTSYEVRGINGVRAQAAKMSALTLAQRSQVIDGLGEQARFVVARELWRAESRQAETSPALAISLVTNLWPTLYDNDATTNTRGAMWFMQYTVFRTLEQSSRYPEYKDAMTTYATRAANRFLKITENYPNQATFRTNVLNWKRDYEGTIRCYDAYMTWVLNAQKINPNNRANWYGQSFVNTQLNAAYAYDRLEKPDAAKAILVYLNTAEWLKNPSPRTKGNFTTPVGNFRKIIRQRLANHKNDDTSATLLATLNSLIVK